MSVCNEDENCSKFLEIIKLKMAEINVQHTCIHVHAIDTCENPTCTMQIQIHSDHTIYVHVNMQWCTVWKHRIGVNYNTRLQSHSDHRFVITITCI